MAEVKAMEAKMGTAAPVVHASVSLFTAVCSASALQLCLMAVSYLTCVSSGHCPKWLPTISNTWEAPPGNYLSRWVVSLVCVFIEIGVLASYHKAKADGMAHPKGVASIAAVGVFCLSWVGAICDSKIPSCRGDDDIHTPLAITFFILFNMYMVIMTAHGKPEGGRRLTLRGLVAVATACTVFVSVHKAHLRDHHHHHYSEHSDSGSGSDTLVAIVEWSDVILILVWFTAFVYEELQTYRMGFVTVDAAAMKGASGPVDVLSFFSATVLTLVATVLCTFTSLSTWAIAVETKVVPGGELPIISDTWWSPPGNWIARWGVVLGATLLYAHELNLYFADRTNTHSESFLLCLLGISGAFGLSVVGCVSDHENLTIHYAGAAVWFVGYDLYMLLYAVRSLLVRSARGALPVTMCLVVSTVSKLRFAAVASAAEGWVPVDLTEGQSLFALYEWSDLAACLLFANIATYYAVSNSAATSTGFAIYSTK